MSLRPEVEELLKSTGVTEMPKSKTKRETPQVYFSISENIGLAQVIRGDVDIVFIDWDEVVPESYLDPSDALEPMELAIEGVLRLPESLMINYLGEMREWLRDNLLDFPENPGYEKARELEKQLVKALSDHGAHP